MNLSLLLLIIVICLLIGLLLGAWSTRIRKTPNRDRAFGSHRFYYVSENPFNPRGARRCYTPREDQEAIAQARKNPEDFA